MLQSIPTDFIGKIRYYFHPGNEFVYLGILAIALVIAVVFKGKRTAKEIWEEMWPKLLFLVAVYIVIIIVVYAVS